MKEMTGTIDTPSTDVDNNGLYLGNERFFCDE